jgi:hypothetical protein
MAPVSIELECVIARQARARKGAMIAFQPLLGRKLPGIARDRCDALSPKPDEMLGRKRPAAALGRQDRDPDAVGTAAIEENVAKGFELGRRLDDRGEGPGIDHAIDTEACEVFERRRFMVRNGPRHLDDDLHPLGVRPDLHALDQVDRISRRYLVDQNAVEALAIGIDLVKVRTRLVAELARHPQHALARVFRDAHPRYLIEDQRNGRLRHVRGARDIDHFDPFLHCGPSVSGNLLDKLGQVNQGAKQI